MAFHLDFKQRTGNGLTNCCLCKVLTWDSWCYDLHVYIKKVELFHTVVCDDCHRMLERSI